MPDVYSHGHHESVLRSHTWRTAENSAAYLLPSLEAGQALLDVGCGPGTITVDLAQRVAPGEVIGIDREAAVLDRARTFAADRAVTNVTFGPGDVYALDFPEGRFDVVHAHQVLQHLSDPVAALREMRRVVRPGGLVAVRESDYATFIWAPKDERLTRWLELYHQLTKHNGAEADAGRFLLGWAQQAGFTDISISASAWTFADPESRRWWGELWADRITKSAFAEQVTSYGLAERAELEEYATAWREWIDKPDGFYAHLNGELLARR